MNYKELTIRQIGEYCTSTLCKNCPVHKWNEESGLHNGCMESLRLPEVSSLMAKQIKGRHTKNNQNGGSKCNRDCFNCPYEDCIDDSVTGEERIDIEARGKSTTQNESERKKSYYAAHKEQYHENYMKHREERIAYDKAYYKKNKEAVIERKKRYHDNNREKVAAWKKKYYEKNKETILAKMKERRHKNAEISV